MEPGNHLIPRFRPSFARPVAADELGVLDKATGQFQISKIVPVTH